MSDVPPVPGPDGAPPPVFAEYPRGPQGPGYGSADQLQALSDSYFGLNYVFLVNVALALTSRALSLTVTTVESALVYLLGSILVMGLVVALFSYRYNKKAAFGLNWQPSMAIVASILLALQSWLCCGAIGIIVMQQIITGEMKKYGIPAGFLGVKKTIVANAIAQLRAAEQNQPRPQ